MIRRSLDAPIQTGRLRKLKRRERPFEYALRDALKPYGIMFVKCKPTIEGFPDRLAIASGEMRLVECKRENGSLSDVQKLRHRELRDHGVKVLVITGPDVRAGVRAVRKALGV